MEPESGAIDTAREAVGLLFGLLGSVLKILGRSSVRFAVSLLLLVVGRSDRLSFLVIDITADFEVELGLRGRSS
jgi:hypothetical protein